MGEQDKVVLETRRTWRLVGSLMGWPYTAEWAPREAPDGEVYWVDFSIWHIIGEGGDENEGVALYECKSADSPLDLVETTKKAEALADGYLKWDGCNHVTWGNSYGHCCDFGGDSDSRREHHEALRSVMLTAAIKFMTQWDGQTPDGEILDPVEVTDE